MKENQIKVAQNVSWKKNIKDTVKLHALIQAKKTWRSILKTDASAATKHKIILSWSI